MNVDQEKTSMKSVVVILILLNTGLNLFSQSADSSQKQKKRN